MAVYDYVRVTDILAGKGEARVFKSIADQITGLEEMGFEFVQFVALANSSMFAIMRRPKK